MRGGSNVVLKEHKTVTTYGSVEIVVSSEKIIHMADHINHPLSAQLQVAIILDLLYTSW